MVIAVTAVRTQRKSPARLVADLEEKNNNTGNGREETRLANVRSARTEHRRKTQRKMIFIVASIERASERRVVRV